MKCRCIKWHPQVSITHHTQRANCYTYNCTLHHQFVYLEQIVNSLDPKMAQILMSILHNTLTCYRRNIIHIYPSIHIHGKELLSYLNCLAMQSHYLGVNLIKILPICKSLNWKSPSSLCITTKLKTTPTLSMVGHARNSWSLAIVAS